MTVTTRDEELDQKLEEAGPGLGVEGTLPGDTIRLRHIATRATSKRRIVVVTIPGDEFDGYAIGVDKKSLQILELPSGDVSSVALEHITSITDGKQFTELTPAEKDIVDRRTASFRKSQDTWLRANWPSVYDRREGDRGEQEDTRLSQSPFKAPYLRSSREQHDYRKPVGGRPTPNQEGR